MSTVGNAVYDVQHFYTSLEGMKLKDLNKLYARVVSLKDRKHVSTGRYYWYSQFVLPIINWMIAERLRLGENK